MLLIVDKSSDSAASGNKDVAVWSVSVDVSGAGVVTEIAAIRSSSLCNLEITYCGRLEDVKPTLHSEPNKAAKGDLRIPL